MTGMTIVLSQSGTSRVVVSSGTHKREGDQRERDFSKFEKLPNAP